MSDSLGPPSAVPGDDGEFNLLIGPGAEILDSRGGRYRVTRRLGGGQFGQVYQVVRLEVDPPCYSAIKITKSDPRHCQQARLEAQILCRLKLNASPEEQQTFSLVIDSFVFAGHLCIVMELLHQDLLEEIKHRNQRGLPLKDIQTCAHSLLLALSVSKRCGIIHGDLKPENIVSTHSSSLSVKLVDFGSSFFSHSPCPPYLQSRYYRAPEVVLQTPYSHPIDIWSLGCVLFEMFIGLPLFPGQSEAHLLDLISLICGQFPSSMTEDSPRRQTWFDADGVFKGQVEICRAERVEVQTISDYYVRRDLRKIIMTYGEDGPRARRAESEKRAMFLDLLVKMLRLPPDERITPDDALREPFITANFSG
jgi:dual specificity protein kinase YAK1